MIAAEVTASGSTATRGIPLTSTEARCAAIDRNAELVYAVPAEIVLRSRQSLSSGESIPSDRELREYVDGQHREGRLVYGMHRSREALLTCIVFSYNGNQVHFVDGSDSGYAIAAHELKAQLKSLRA